MNDSLIIGQGTSLDAWQNSEKLAALPAISAELLVPAGSRAVIVAPHPDDEVLGFGGLMQQLAALGRPLLLISVTNGSASHPGSRLWPEERLTIVRPQESAEAIRRLDIPADNLEWIRGGFQDTGVADQESLLASWLLRYLRTNDVLFTTWQQDGHGDHEAVGRACATACTQSGARLHEVPIWAWHWAAPEDSRLPWERAHKILLSAQAIANKRHACQAFTSQLEGDPLIGLGPVLAPFVVERLMQPFEVVFT
jgi:LmbE family N-acetylglucosaminyl deacetylase